MCSMTAWVNSEGISQETRPGERPGSKCERGLNIAHGWGSRPPDVRNVIFPNSTSVHRCDPEWLAVEYLECLPHRLKRPPQPVLGLTSSPHGLARECLQSRQSLQATQALSIR
jgi:hypothetical protein